MLARAGGSGQAKKIDSPPAGVRVQAQSRFCFVLAITLSCQAVVGALPASAMYAPRSRRTDECEPRSRAGAARGIDTGPRQTASVDGLRGRLACGPSDASLLQLRDDIEMHHRRGRRVAGVSQERRAY